MTYPVALVLVLQSVMPCELCCTEYVLNLLSCVHARCHLPPLMKPHVLSACCSNHGCMSLFCHMQEPVALHMCACGQPRHSCSCLALEFHNINGRRITQAKLMTNAHVGKSASPLSTGRPGSAAADKNTVGSGEERSHRLPASP